MLHTPLRTWTIGGAAYRWYGLPPSFAPPPIDLLVIDGPPGTRDPQARYPALPLLQGRLGPRAVVLLDDAARPGEAGALRRWAEEYPQYSQDLIPTRRGTAILRRSGAGAAGFVPGPREPTPGPQFLGIGAQKCGTSWLYEQLRAHPDVAFPGGKEIHFWDRGRARGVDWWLGRFARGGGRVRGEITPAYATLPAAVIREVRAAAPDVRLFYSIRNPIARAWSAALMALSRAELTIDEASDRWFLDHFRSRGSRRRGDYLACLDAWRAAFPPDQLHLILFDDIAADPRSVLAGLAGHLALDPAPFDRIPEDRLRRPAFPGPGHPIRPRLLESLRAQYREDIGRLGARLGRDLAGWLAWPGA